MFFFFIYLFIYLKKIARVVSVPRQSHSFICRISMLKLKPFQRKIIFDNLSFFNSSDLGFESIRLFLCSFLSIIWHLDLDPRIQVSNKNLTTMRHAIQTNKRKKRKKKLTKMGKYITKDETNWLLYGGLVAELRLQEGGGEEVTELCWLIPTNMLMINIHLA